MGSRGRIRDWLGGPCDSYDYNHGYCTVGWKSARILSVCIYDNKRSPARGESNLRVKSLCLLIGMIMMSCFTIKIRSSTTEWIVRIVTGISAFCTNWPSTISSRVEVAVWTICSLQKMFVAITYAQIWRMEGNYWCVFSNMTHALLLQIPDRFWCLLQLEANRFAEMTGGTVGWFQTHKL